MENDPFGTFKGIEPGKQPENEDQEEPDLYDAVAEYRRNHPQRHEIHSKPRQVGQTEAQREEMRKQIKKASNDLYQLLIEARKLEIYYEIKISNNFSTDRNRLNFIHFGS